MRIGKCQEHSWQLDISSTSKFYADAVLRIRVIDFLEAFLSFQRSMKDHDLSRTR